MSLKINKLFILIFLTFMQSCSGGRIGNFLESSFKNVEETKRKENIKMSSNKKGIISTEKKFEDNKNPEETKRKENIKITSNKKRIISTEKKFEDNKNTEETKRKENIKLNSKNKKFFNSSEQIKKTKKNITDKRFSEKRKYEPQSYKIIFILKDVDPKDPIEDLSTILEILM